MATSPRTSVVPANGPAATAAPAIPSPRSSTTFTVTRTGRRAGLGAEAVTTSDDSGEDLTGGASATVHSRVDADARSAGSAIDVLSAPGAPTCSRRITTPIPIARKRTQAAAAAFHFVDM